MKKKLFFGLLVLTLIALPLFTACPAETTPTPTTPKPTAATPTPPPANWWDELGKPQYGGVFTIQASSLKLDLDPYSTWGGQYGYFGDFLWVPDWTVDRQIWPFQSDFVPHEYQAGCLVETWEMSDPQTMIVHLRKGVHWHNKPPVNGREFTADDVQFHYDRLLGTGSGFTEPNPFWISRSGLFEKVTALDKYTVEFKLKYATYPGLLTIMQNDGLNWTEAREWVELNEESKTDWTNAVGTGPWLLTDFASGTSATFSRNPDYWGYDERYPENQLPYADELRILVIPDVSTAIAALRTGKLDALERVAWQQAETLAESNPELKQAKLPAPGQGVVLRVDHEPFTDIRVRKAMEMALDRQTIAQSLYGGTVDGIPCGVVSPTFKEYTFAYEDWPKELQEEYSYNPERARELLAEAGYPNGFDTNVVMVSTLDVNLAQTFKAYFHDIGIEMEIKLMDPAAAMPFAFARKHDQMWWQANGCGRTFVIQNCLVSYKSKEMANYGMVEDPAYDKLYDDYLACTTADEAKKLAKEADLYAMQNHWTIVTFPVAEFIIYQPYLKGYSGELIGENPAIWARLWIDQSLKK